MSFIIGFPWEDFGTIEKTLDGILEQDVLYQYIEKRKRETQILEERILEIMLESMDEGMEG